VKIEKLEINFFHHKIDCYTWLQINLCFKKWRFSRFRNFAAFKEKFL